MTKLALDCKRFITSTEFANYVHEFTDAYRVAVATVGLDRFASREDWPNDWNPLGKFCQAFWETLPNSPDVRHGAFFTLRDFAEDWCFESDDCDD